MTGAQDHEHHQDPTFYRSPRDAAAAPAEKLAYVATFSRPADQREQLTQMNNMGGLSGLAAMLPGIAKVKNQITERNLVEKLL